jgi:hypothetical protein
LFGRRKRVLPGVAAQQVAGADLAVENPFEAVLAFAVLQVKCGDTSPAARRLSSGPMSRNSAALLFGSSGAVGGGW